MKIVAMWRTGGLVLSLGFLTLFIGGGGRHAIGLVLKPMAESQDWDRTLISGVIAVFMLCTAFAMVLVGRLCDRFSPAWVLTGGAVVCGIGIGAMTFADAAWHAFLLYGVVFAVGNGALSITPVGVMLTRRFGANAATANSIAIAGMGLGQLVILSGLSVVLVDAGWRNVFLYLGLANLVAAPILLFGLRREARAGIAAPLPVAKGEARERGIGMSVSEARRTAPFWYLMIFYAVCGFQDFFVSSHVVAFALDQGGAELFAGNLLAFMGLAGLIGVLAAGWWSDQSGPVWPTLFCFILRIGVFALVLVDTSTVSVAVFALAYGLTFWVTAPLTVIFVRDNFGDRNLGLISGLVTMTHHIAGGVGALTGGAMYDTSGDYRTAFVLMVVLSIAAATVTYAFARSQRGQRAETGG